ncbi:MAG: hypothetical protein IJ231_10300 [Clostridia bacterium]|nr:hypothetical protein [Clostridia bacterium]
MPNPLKLLKTHEYAAYQLVFRMSRTDENGDLKKSDYTMCYFIDTIWKWLKKKIGDPEFSGGKAHPERDFESCGLYDFTSYHIHGGFSIDITSIPSEGKWAMRLKEPDVGVDDRPAVLGRSIVTHVACHKDDEYNIACAVKISILDPEDAPELPYAFRPGFIRTFIETQGCHLEAVAGQEAIEVKSIKELTSMLNGNLPLTVFTYSREKMLTKDIISQLTSQLPTFQMLFSDNKQLIDQVDIKIVNLAYDAYSFASDVFAYSYTFIIPDELFEQFNEWIKTRYQRNVTPGDIVCLGATRFDSSIRVWPYSEKASKFQRDRVFDDVLKFVHTYSKHKPYNYEGFIFERDLREEERLVKQQQIKEMTQEETLLQLVEQEEKTESLKEEIKDLKTERDNLRWQLSMLKEQSDNVLRLNMPEEEEYFADEIHDMVLSVLEKVDRSQSAYPEGSRGDQLLKWLLNQNQISGQGKSLFDEIESIMTSTKNMTDADFAKLKQLGFEIEKQGNNHYRLYFKGNKSRSIRIGSTISSSRSMTNSFHDFLSNESIY